MAPTADLVPVDRATASEAGFLLPLFLTRPVYEDCVAWSDDDTTRTGALQDEAGRLWDMAYMAASAARGPVGWRRRGLTDPLPAMFHVYRVPRDLDRSRLAELEDDPDEWVAQPVRLVIRRDPSGLIIDFAEAVA